MMELMRVPPQNPIYNNLMLPIAVAQNMHNVDNFAVWDRNKVIKLVTGVGLSIIFIYILERFENGNYINPPIIPPNPSTVNPSSLLFPSTPQTLKPCVPTITAYRVILDGDCNHQEIDAAYAKSKQLFDERQVELKEEGRRMAQEASKLWQSSSDTSRYNLNKAIRERDQAILDNAEYLRKMNPTPEEIAFKKALQKIEIDCEMDEKFFGWPFYEPRGCHLPELNLLGAYEAKNCDELKSKYRKTSLMYHPDKNNSTEAVQKFIDITNAFEKLCPS